MPNTTERPSNTVETGLTEFLLARIAEDEAVARDVMASERRDMVRAPGDWPAGFDPLADFYLGGADGPIGYTAIVVGVGRLLAECEAKRRIIEQATQASEDHDAIAMEFSGTTRPVTRADPGQLILRALASLYAGHQDYRDDWRS